MCVCLYPGADWWKCEQHGGLQPGLPHWGVDSSSSGPGRGREREEGRRRQRTPYPLGSHPHYRSDSLTVLLLYIRQAVYMSVCLLDVLRSGSPPAEMVKWVSVNVSSGVCCDKYSQQQVHTPRDPRLSQTARDPSNSTGAPSTVPPSSPELSIPTSPPPSTPPGPFTTCPFNELQTGSVEVQLPPPAPWQPAGKSVCLSVCVSGLVFVNMK